MKSPPRDVEDLIAQSRRGCLARVDAQELDSRLRASAEARLLFQAGQGFDRESAVLPGDDELASRLAARAARALQHQSAKAGRTTRVSRVRVALSVALGILAGTTVAAAWSLAQRILDPVSDVEKRAAPLELPSATPLPPRGVRGGGVPPPRSSASSGPDRSPVRPSTAAFSDLPATSRDRPEKSLLPGPARADVEPIPTTAEAPCAALFAHANRARRQGASSVALELYRSVESRCSGTAEAREARLIAGMLYLDRGQGSLALAEFDAYLATGSGGAVLAEGLWGRARALRQLGRTDEEQQVLGQVIAAAPRSPYAEAARQRLNRVLAP